MIYLDNAATTLVHPKVAQALAERLAQPWANPSSSHRLGMQARQVLNQARRNLAQLFQLPEEALTFTASGTESINLALQGSLKPGDTLVIGGLEHPAVTETAAALETRGVRVHRLSHDPATGLANLAELAAHLQAGVRLVSLQWVNSETGIIQDLAAVSALIRQTSPETLLHVDGVQAFGKLPFQMEGIDLCSLSAHKFRALPGAGLLLRGKSQPLKPILFGGGQEAGLRSGTENLYAIYAMELAATIAVQNLAENHRKIAVFGDELIQALQIQIPEIQIFNPPNRAPQILSLAIPGVLGEVLLNHLSAQGIYVSTGSACNARSKKLSGTLKALGFRDHRIKESIRLSFHADFLPPSAAELAQTIANTAQEIKALGI